MKYHLAPIKMPLFLKKQKLTSADKYAYKLESLCAWWECKMVQLLWKTVIVAP